MDSLANFLVENILNEEVNPITALFGGGFKPPTAGHLEVVKKAINDNPEIDKIIIYVGGKARNGVTQDQAIEIWDKFYKPQINKPVEILPSVAPIKDIYRYAKNNPEETVYWVIGAREGREDDLKDIANRSISIDKYPNLQLKTTSTPDGGMSGTNARKAIVNNNFEEFERYLPDNVDKNAIWDILTKQELNEADPKTGTGKKPKGSGRRLYTDEDPSDTVKVKFSSRQDIVDTLNKKSFKAKSHARQSQIINLIHQRVRAAYNRAKDPDVKRRLKTALDYAEQRKEASKKKTQRLKKQKTNEAIDTNFNKVKFYHDYYTNISPSTFGITIEENDIKISNIIEPYPSNFGPKNVRQIPVDQNLEENIDPKAQAKHKGKSAPFGSAYEPVKEKKSGGRGTRYRAIEKRGNQYYYIQDNPFSPGIRQEKDIKEGDTIEKYSAKGKATGKLKQGTVRKRLGIKKDEKIPLSTINKEISRLKKMDKDKKKPGAQLGDKNKKYYKALQLAKTLKTTTNVNESGLKIAKKNMDDYKRSNNPSGKKPKDPFGLNQFARELIEEENFDNFDYPKHLKLYTQYMLDQGMDIRPLPKVKFINNDVENAKEFLGKTAYYDPTNRLIVLYTLNRHPKDVMRSFSHEMIHHLQNNQNRLGRVVTTNTTQDDHVDNLEKEANLLGTMTFRHWTDTLTEGVLKEGRYDRISNEISSNIFNQWKKDFDNGKEASRYFDNVNNELDIDIDANITFLPNSEKLTIDGGAEEAAENGESAYLEVRFEVDPEMLPEFWEEISMNLKDVVRHEIEHITQSGYSAAGGYKKVYKKVDGKWEETGKYEWQGKDFDDDQVLRDMINMELLPKAQYFKLSKEIDANLQGMYFRAKKEKIPFGDIINNYLDAQDITAKEKEEILDLWRSRNKVLNLPQF